MGKVEQCNPVAYLTTQIIDAHTAIRERAADGADARELIALTATQFVRLEKEGVRLSKQCGIERRIRLTGYCIRGVAMLAIIEIFAALWLVRYWHG